MQFFKRKFDQVELESKTAHAQSGAMIMDNMVAVGFISMLVIGIVASIPALTHKLNVTKFQSQVNEITNAAVQWKKQRPNFEGITLQKLCDYDLINESLCSNTAKGAAINAFGGDFVLTAVKGTYTLEASLPNLEAEQGRVNDLADTLAPITKYQCKDAGTMAGTGVVKPNDCGSISAKSKSATIKLWM
ncbi:hypothetical protein [Vibrio harveyi]